MNTSNMCFYCRERISLEGSFIAVRRVYSYIEGTKRVVYNKFHIGCYLKSNEEGKKILKDIINEVVEMVQSMNDT